MLAAALPDDVTPALYCTGAEAGVVTTPPLPAAAAARPLPGPPVGKLLAATAAGVTSWPVGGRAEAAGSTESVDVAVLAVPAGVLPEDVSPGLRVVCLGVCSCMVLSRCCRPLRSNMSRLSRSTPSCCCCCCRC